MQEPPQSLRVQTHVPGRRQQVMDELPRLGGRQHPAAGTRGLAPLSRGAVEVNINVVRSSSSLLP